ncbi:MAG: ABC transporter permease, partial [Deltaproteobacteria bacterium]|nr:ABC transporter permease [Deltaproteobacteria bacterium]
MYKYYLKRLLLVIPTLLGITLITFALLQALPGDPVQGMVGEHADPEVVEQIRADLGADRPFVRQYFGYLKLISTGELGRSYYTNRTVTDAIAEKLPNTIILALGA